MRKKKVRGHRRRWKAIENWRLHNTDLDLTDYLLNERERFYVKIGLHPWGSLSLTNSEWPQPRGKTKQKIIEALIDIYEDWQHQLDQLGQPYYLKIWFFEPYFSKSQVVCAIGECVNFYENTFHKSDADRGIQLDYYGNLRTKLSKFLWEHHLDEVHYDNTEFDKPEQYASRQDYEEVLEWFEKLLKKPHRVQKFNKPIGEATQLYSFKCGDVWLGGKE